MGNRAEAVKGALDYLTRSGVDVPADIWQRVLKARVFKAEGGIPVINADYHNRITEALISYLEGSGSVTAPRNAFKRAMVEAFGAAFDLGWHTGGGELPAEPDAQDWLAARVDAEMGYIDQVLQNAKELRAEGGDYFEWVTSRADGFTASVPSVYNYAKMAAAGNQMLEWRYGDTDHCDTCASLNGQKHRAKWYIARDYIPRKPGAAMTCGGYRCMCSLLTKDGEEFTL